MKYILYERQYYTANQKPQAEADITAFAKANNAEAVASCPSGLQFRLHSF